MLMLCFLFFSLGAFSLKSDKGGAALDCMCHAASFRLSCMVGNTLSRESLGICENIDKNGENTLL